MQKTVTPVLKSIRNPPDTVNDYKNDYGYLGPQLQVAVVKARQTPVPAPTSITTTPLRAITPTTTRIIQQTSMQGAVSSPRAVVVNKPPGTHSTQQQKVIIMTSRPQTPSQVSFSDIL